MQKIYILSVLILFSLSSCLVTKKKYDAMNELKQKKIDSLEYVIDKTLFDYKNSKKQNEELQRKNESRIDSLIAETGKLSRDTSELSSSLAEAIKEYQEKQRILKETEERLDKKSKLIERLTAKQEMKAREIDSLQNSLQGTEERLDKKSKLIERLTAEQEMKAREIDSLQNSLKEKQERLVMLENMINKNKKEVEKLKNTINEALKSFDNSELNVYLKDGKVYVAMEEKLLFKTGSSAIDKRGKEAIKKLGKILEKNIDTEILIEGHTDNVGSDSYNWKLSTERALSVVHILRENTKIKPERITASGRGMHKPVADNASDAGKQKNRRIDIVLIPKLDLLYKIMNE